MSHRLIAFGTDPDNGRRLVLDLAEAETLAPLHELIELHDYRVGAVDHPFGTPILEVQLEAFTHDG